MHRRAPEDAVTGQFGDTIPNSEKLSMVSRMSLRCRKPLPHNTLSRAYNIT